MDHSYIQREKKLKRTLFLTNNCPMVDYVCFDPYITGLLICSEAAGDGNEEIGGEEKKNRRGTKFLSFISKVRKPEFEKRSQTVLEKEDGSDLLDTKEKMLLECRICTLELGLGLFLGPSFFQTVH